MEIGCKECGNSDAGHYLGVLFHKDDCNARRRKMFSKRHYQAIAEVISDTASTVDLSGNDSGHGNELSCCSRPSVVALITRMESMFERDNPKFDRVRFLDACGLGIAKPAIVDVQV